MKIIGLVGSPRKNGNTDTLNKKHWKALKSKVLKRKSFI
jgi:multimeric flavodoxin WrbA